MIKQPILQHIEQEQRISADDHIFMAALDSSLLLTLKERGLLNATQHLQAEQMLQKSRSHRVSISK